jgi:hypothetical protein
LRAGTDAFGVVALIGPGAEGARNDLREIEALPDGIVAKIGD